MERIEDKQRYQSQQTLRQKLQQLLSKNLMWLPVILGILGLFLFFRIYQPGQQGKQLPSVKYDELVDYQDYQKQEENSGNKLQHLKQRLTQEAQENKRKRYERIIGGSDLVHVKYQDQLKTVVPDSVSEQKDTLAVAKKDSSSYDSVKQVNFVSAPKRKIAKKASIQKANPISRNPVAQNEPVSVESTIQPDTSINNKIRLAEPKKQSKDSVLNKGTGAFNLIVVDQAFANFSSTEFVKAYVYGEQELMQGSFLKLRLAEDLVLADGSLIPRNTVFHGQVAVRSNIVEITIHQIRQHAVQLAVYDRDYSYGILLEPDRNNQQAANQTLYRSGNRSAADIPLDLAQDLTRALIQQERRKARVIKINDGYPLYIAKPLSK